MSIELTLVRSSRSGRLEIPYPDWEDVENALRSLDGHTHCELFLGSPDSTEGLMVIGGPARHLIWIQRWDAAGEELLIDTASERVASSGTVSFVLSNGQVDEYPMASTVELEASLQVARTFLDRELLDPDVIWVRQGR